VFDLCTKSKLWSLLGLSTNLLALGTHPPSVLLLYVYICVAFFLETGRRLSERPSSTDYNYDIEHYIQLTETIANKKLNLSGASPNCAIALDIPTLLCWGMMPVVIRTSADILPCQLLG